MKYRIEVKNEIEKQFAKQWKQLWQSAENANLYNSYEWFLTCLETDAVKEYEIHAFYKDDKLIALLPLQQYKIFGVKVWGTLDKDHLLDTGFLIEKYDTSLIKFFFDNIFTKRNIYLQRVDTQATEMLHKKFPELFISLMSVNPIIKLTNDTFENASSSMKYQMRKLIRKNEKEIEFKMYNTNLEKHLEEIFVLQKKSSKNARSMDVFENEGNKKYYRSLTKNCKEFIRISFLYFNNLPIAYEYGCSYKKHYAGDQISFLQEYKKLSPGKLIVYLLLNYLKEKDVNELDMGGGISSYKMSFTNDYRVLYNIYYSQNKLTMFWWKTVNKARRIKQIGFPKKFTRDHEFLFKTI